MIMRLQDIGPQNYWREVRVALAGDPQPLADAIRRGKPMTDSDRDMVADYVAGMFRGKPMKRRGRPVARTLSDMLRSAQWQDRAALDVFLRSERAKAGGRVRAPMGAILKTVALLEGVDEGRLAEAVKKRLPIIRRDVAKWEQLLADVHKIRAEKRGDGR